MVIIMPSELTVSITGVEPKRGGAEVELRVAIASGERREERVLRVAAEMLFEIGNITGDRLPYPLSEEEFDRLERFAAITDAVNKGLYLLSYGSCTASALAKKLSSRGYDRETAREAAEYLRSNGSIDEERLLRQYYSILTKQKRLGPNRIRAELLQKGFSREHINERLEGLMEETDFDELLDYHIEKKLRGEQLTDRKKRAALIASLQRLGFSTSAIIRVLKRE